MDHVRNKKTLIARRWIIIFTMIFMREIVPTCPAICTSGGIDGFFSARGIGISFGGIKAIDEVGFSVRKVRFSSRAERRRQGRRVSM